MMRLLIKKMLLATCGIILSEGVAGFSCQHSSARTSCASTTSQLMMSSSPSQQSTRRDILSTGALGLSALVINPNDALAGSFRIGPITPQSAANKAAESYQGVWSDPMHPNGYRIIMASPSGGGATMTISDGLEKDAPEGAEAETYKNVPVAIKEGSNELSFDFSFKGGPKEVPGILSDDKQHITFPDGNRWTKNAKKFDGIYKDPKYPNGYRIIRSNGSYNTLTEINNTGDPKDSIFIKGKHASLYAIPTSEITFYDFPGREKVERKKPTNVLAWAAQKAASPDDTAVVGQLSLEDKNTAFPYGTITFPDGTVWTRI